MPSEAQIPIPWDAVARFCRERGIRRLALFGSVIWDDFTPESDVDILVEFLPGRLPSLFTLVGYQVELAELLGREVDLRTPEDLSKFFREEVLAEARDIYGSAAEACVDALRFARHRGRHAPKTTGPVD